MNEFGRLLVPALRWDRAHGFRYLDGLVDDALELGVGGFLIDGGPRDEVATLVARLHAESPEPILVAAHAERGAGSAFDGLTELPPFAAVASVAVVQPADGGGLALDVEVVRRAARLTVRELKNVGINWALAPVCDRDGAPGDLNRRAGSDPAVVGAIVAEWIDACQAEAVLACAMHFPGDPLAFGAAIDAGVASVMVSPAPSPAAREGAMYSAAAIENVLRGELHFDGLATTVVLDREPSLAPSSESGAAIRAIAAGCDLVFAPGDLSGTADALARAAGRREIGDARVRNARERVDRWAGWAGPSIAPEPSLDDVMWSRQLADRSVRFLSGTRPRIGATLEVVHVGGGMARESLDPFLEVLRAMHIDVTVSPTPTPKERAPLAVVCDPAVDAADARILDATRAAAKVGSDAGRDVVIVALCHPTIASALTRTVAVLCSWDSTRPMLQAAARALVTSR